MKLKLLVVLIAIFIALPALAAARPIANIRSAEVRDVNWAAHAGMNEDFNFMWDGNTAADVNADVNYIIRLSYNGNYIDLNGSDMNHQANVTFDANFASDSPCFANGKDINIFRPWQDVNSMWIGTTIPGGHMDINHFIGKVVAVELWKVVISEQGTAGGQPTGGDFNYTCVEVDANATLIVTPAIVLNSTTNMADGNVTVMGYGFQDGNVMIRYSDANGQVVDLNMMDVNYAGNLYADVNGWNGDTRAGLGASEIVWGKIQAADARKWADDEPDYGGVVQPDANGNFDVNVVVPVTFSMPTPDGIPDNNIWATSLITNRSDANASIRVAPAITLPDDMNVTVMVCRSPGKTTCYSGGTRKDIIEAIYNDDINNMYEVRGVTVQLGLSTTTVFGKVELNQDLNVANGPKRDYNLAMAGALGFADINTEQLSEFVKDSNITLYNVPSWEGKAPILAKNGRKCSPTACTNFDGTSFSAGYTSTAHYTGDINSWYWNPIGNDGNLMFRSGSFSTYGTSTLDMNLMYPNGGEFVDNRDGTDGNVQVEFHWSDSNIWGSPVINLALSDTNGDFDIVLLRDLNLLDPLKLSRDANGVTCSDLDGNAATLDANCTYDMNIWWYAGTYFVDINIMHGTVGPDGNNWMVDSSDYNFFVNAPTITITDTNWSTPDWNWTYWSAEDFNYWVDFNVLLPFVDQTGDDGDDNSMWDYKVSVYLSPVKSDGRGPDQNVYVWDHNLGYYCNDNSAQGTINGKNYWQVNPVDCNIMISMSGAGGHVDSNRYYLRIDVNYGSNPTNNRGLGKAVDLVASKESDQNVIINDINAPALAILAPAGGTASTTANQYTITWQGIDPRGGIDKYWWSAENSVWHELDGHVTSYTMSLAQGLTSHFYLKAEDEVDLNSSVSTVSISMADLGTGETPPGGVPPGGSPGGTPPIDEDAVTETLLEETVSIKPTADEITDILTEAGASEEAIAKASAAVEKTTVERTVKVEKITASTGAISYKTTVTVKVSNPGGKIIRNVKVVEKIPKSVIAHLNESQVSASVPFEILKADPIIAFTVSEVMPNETEEIVYSVDARANSSDVGAWFAPIVSGMEEYENPCDTVVCEEMECQGVLCNPRTGECEYEALSDGLACSIGTCEAGTCVAPPVEPPEPPPEEPVPQDNTALIVAVIIVVVLAGAYYFFVQKKKGNKGLAQV